MLLSLLWDESRQNSLAILHLLAIRVNSCNIDVLQVVVDVDGEEEGARLASLLGRWNHDVALTLVDLDRSGVLPLPLDWRAELELLLVEASQEFVLAVIQLKDTDIGVVQSLLERIVEVGLVVWVGRILNNGLSATTLGQGEKDFGVLVGLDQELRVLGVFLETSDGGGQARRVAGVPLSIESDTSPSLREVDVDKDSGEHVSPVFVTHEEGAVVVVV